MWASPSGEEKCILTINIEEKFGSNLLLLDTARVMEAGSNIAILYLGIMLSIRYIAGV